MLILGNVILLMLYHTHINSELCSYINCKVVRVPSSKIFESQSTNFLIIQKIKRSLEGEQMTLTYCITMCVRDLYVV